MFVGGVDTIYKDKRTVITADEKFGFGGTDTMGELLADCSRMRLRIRALISAGFMLGRMANFAHQLAVAGLLASIKYMCAR